MDDATKRNFKGFEGAVNDHRERLQFLEAERKAMLGRLAKMEKALMQLQTAQAMNARDSGPTARS